MSEEKGRGMKKKERRKREKEHHLDHPLRHSLQCKFSFRSYAAREPTFTLEPKQPSIQSVSQKGGVIIRLERL